MEIGPQLPKHSFLKTSDASKCSEEVTAAKKLKIVPSEETECSMGIYGPAVPPGFKQRTSDIVGPCRPENSQHLKKIATG